MALLSSAAPEAKAFLAEARAGTTSFREISRRFIHACFHDPQGRKALAFQGLHP